MGMLRSHASGLDHLLHADSLCRGRLVDWTIVDYSRIARLPKPLQPIALIARNAAKAIKSFMPRFPHLQDNVGTRNIVGFLSEPVFKRAYERGIEAGGWDYQIPFRVHQALWCSHQAQKVAGDFVELGTGRGFVMSAVLEAYPNWPGETRALHLFDTFSPVIPNERGEQAEGEMSPHYAKGEESVKANFSEWPRVHLHPGDVFETLPSADLSAVAFLHVDLNYYAAEVFGIRHLWDRIPRGGVMLLDDYANAGREQQHQALNELAAELGFQILTTPTGQGLVIK